MNNNNIPELREKSSCLTAYATALITQLYSECDENEKRTEKLEKVMSVFKNINEIFSEEEDI